MLSRPFKSNLWLQEFLKKREMEGPTGSPLFTYHAEPSEFVILKTELQKCVQKAQSFGYEDPFKLWDRETDYAIFVLYASIFWQQTYDGSSWSWNAIWESLGVSPSAVSNSLGDIVRKGLAWWGLRTNTSGYVYLGSIAREAGLPQKLLTDGHGSVGYILDMVLKTALKCDASEALILSWVDAYKARLPLSYQKSAIVSLLADTIKAVLDIKKKITTSTVDDARNELERKYPGWRKAFPLPLNDDVAHNLINRLLDNAIEASAGYVRMGSPMRITRRIKQTDDGDWELLASLFSPARISILEGIKERLLGLRISASTKYIDTILRLHTDNDSSRPPVYFMQGQSDYFFKGEDAASEFLLQYSSSSGVLGMSPCVGGAALDAELPWIFDSKEFDFAFRQQGGGSVHGMELYAALCPGWSVPEATELGALKGTSRTVWKITQNSILEKDGLSFKVRLGCAQETESLGWDRMGRIWTPEIISPSLAFQGLPDVLLQAGDRSCRCNGKLLWKREGMENYVPLERSTMRPGPANVWFRAASGASLRSRMLLLPKNASFTLEPSRSDGGYVHLKGWQIAEARLIPGQSDISLKSSRYGEDLTLDLELAPGALPPEYTELELHWAGCTQPARIRFPFPQKGARIFDAEGKHIEKGNNLCVSRLHGLRLFYFGLGFNSAKIRLSLSGDKNKRIDYPLDARENVQSIRLVDLKESLLEMLALESGIDARVRLEVFSSEERLSWWDFSRYDEQLAHGENEVVLDIEENSASSSRAIKALLLSQPELGSRDLPRVDIEGDGKQRWSTLPLNEQGPWLIFDSSEGSAMRPLLRFVQDGQPPQDMDRLQQAICADETIRAMAFRDSIAFMERDPMAKEWNTLISLLSQLHTLPLSTLEVWKELIRSPFAMAILALHPNLSFKEITSRASSELPFLWSLVTRKDWSNASKHILSVYNKMFGNLQDEGKMATMMWEDQMKRRLDAISSYCPAVWAMLHISIPLPENKNNLLAVKNYYNLATTRNHLYIDDNSPLQEVMRRHADDEWPTYFLKDVKRQLGDNEIRKFIPRLSEWQYSVIGLPVLLTLQNYTSQSILFSRDYNADLIFQIRRHLSFSLEWFEQAAQLIAFCCFSEDFKL